MVALHIGGCIGFYRRFRRDNDSAASYLFAASAIMVASQVFNTFYAHPYDIYNLLSHVYRVVFFCKCSDLKNPLCRFDSDRRHY